MSAFENLPYKLTVQIVKEIGGSKLSRFDTVATGDLQNLRLVSTRFDQIVSPILFQTLIWDQRFLRHKDVHRVIKFVNLFPHLAGYVQDVLVRIPPENTAPAIDDLAGTRAFLRTTGVSEAKGLTEVHEEMYYRLMVAPLRLWKNLAEDDVAITDRAIGRVYRQTFERLPNLRHIETAVSTHYYECLATASDIVAAELNIYVEKYARNARFSEGLALTSAYTLILLSCPLRVKSLKFRQVPLIEKLSEWCPVPGHIQDLDIEFQIPSDYLTEGEGQRRLGKAIQEWREQMRSLRLLRSLVIEFCGSWKAITRLPLLNESPFHIHKLLPRLSQVTYNPPGTKRSGKAPQNGPSDAAFPNLTALTLRNVPADPFTLIEFVTTHQFTLKSLVLHRISLDIGRDMDWAQLGTQLSVCVPNLAYLELFRIGTHSVGWYNEEGEIVEENDKDASQRMIACQLLDEDEVEVVYQNAGWGGEDDYEDQRAGE